MNFRGWGYGNNQITFEGVRSVLKSIGKCPALEVLVLDFSEWRKLSNENLQILNS